MKITLSAYTHAFNGPFSGTTQVSRYQKSKANLDFTEARDSEWQWHHLGRMQVCTRQITTPALHDSVFYRLDALPSAQPTESKHWRQCVCIYLGPIWNTAALTTKSGPMDCSLQRAISPERRALTQSAAATDDDDDAEWCKRWCKSLGRSTSRKVSEWWVQNCVSRGTASCHKRSLSIRIAAKHVSRLLPWLSEFTDWVVVSRPTRPKTGHFGDDLLALREAILMCTQKLT